MFLPDTPQDHDNRMYEVGLSDGKDEAAKRIAELEAALGKAIIYCDAATHGDEQYADERSTLIRALRGS